jgi:hypothetical protein
LRIFADSPIRISVVLVVPEMLGHLLIQRGFQHGFREQLQQPIRTGQGQTLLAAWATIAAAATCSGDNCGPTFLIFVYELTASDVITHSAHPTGPQPGVSGRKHRWLHSPWIAPCHRHKCPEIARSLLKELATSVLGVRLGSVGQSQGDGGARVGCFPGLGEQSRRDVWMGEDGVAPFVKVDHFGEQFSA